MLITANLTQANTESETFLHNGGVVQVEASGVFNGATVKMETSQDELTFVVLSNFTMTGNDVLRVNMQPGTKYKFSIISAGGSTDIAVSII